MKLAAQGAAGCAAVLVLAGTPALASSHAQAKASTGPEIISGTATGRVATANVSKVPVRFQGVVHARGFVTLATSKSKTHTLQSTAGKFTVVNTGKQVTETENKRTCHFTYTQDGTYNVVGSKSTGTFAGASGPGAVRIFFTGYEPRFTSGPHKGQCNGNARPLRKGAVLSFLASTVLTVK